MTAERHTWAGGKVEEFDYAKMAAEALERVHTLEAGIARVKARPVRGMNESLHRYAVLQFLEEVLWDQKDQYKHFCQKARDRGQMGK